MRVIVVGATGNVGTSVVKALESDSRWTSIVGVARRLPGFTGEKTTYRAADISTDDLVEIFSGADVVIHLAWLFQPMRNPVRTWRNNVLGAIRVFNAVAEAKVPALVYASSVGAYSPGGLVDETWPTHGWPGAPYGREKAYLERVLDALRARPPRHPGGPDAARVHLQARGRHPAAAGCSSGRSPRSRAGSRSCRTSTACTSRSCTPRTRPRPTAWRPPAR